MKAYPNISNNKNALNYIVNFPYFEPIYDFPFTDANEILNYKKNDDINISYNISKSKCSLSGINFSNINGNCISLHDLLNSNFWDQSYEYSSLHELIHKVMINGIDLSHSPQVKLNSKGMEESYNNNYIGVLINNLNNIFIDNNCTTGKSHHLGYGYTCVYAELYSEAGSLWFNSLKHTSNPSQARIINYNHYKIRTLEKLRDFYIDIRKIEDLWNPIKNNLGKIKNSDYKFNTNNLNKINQDLILYLNNFINEGIWTISVYDIMFFIFGPPRNICYEKYFDKYEWCYSSSNQ